jgi:fructose transport system ATP-binding protein
LTSLSVRIGTGRPGAHIHWPGRRIAPAEPRGTTMEEAVAVMTGAKSPDPLHRLDGGVA